MEKYRHWKVTVKEYGKDNLLHPSVSGNYTEEQVIAFLGLNEPDVEWYTIEEEELK